MDSQMLDRLWVEIDNNVGRVERLSKIVYEQAVTLRIIVMVVWLIMSIILGSSVLINWDRITNKPQISMSHYPPVKVIKRSP